MKEEEGNESCRCLYTYLTYICMYDANYYSSWIVSNNISWKLTLYTYHVTSTMASEMLLFRQG